MHRELSGDPVSREQRISRGKKNHQMCLEGLWYTGIVSLPWGSSYICAGNNLRYCELPCSFYKCEGEICERLPVSSGFEPGLRLDLTHVCPQNGEVFVLSMVKAAAKSQPHPKHQATLSSAKWPNRGNSNWLVTTGSWPHPFQTLRSLLLLSLQLIFAKRCFSGKWLQWLVWLWLVHWQSSKS